jgi:hypothetical protein
MLSEGRVHRTVEVVSYANREEDFALEALASKADGEPPMLRMDASPNEVDALGGQLAAEEEDWTTLRNRIGYGHACWVTTTSFQRPLTPQTHFLSPPSPAPSPHPPWDGSSDRSRTPTPEPSSTVKRGGELFFPRPAGPVFLHRRSATTVNGSVRHAALTHKRRRSSGAKLGGGNHLRGGSGPTRSAPPAHDELAFVQSFPSGAVRSTAYET